MSSGFGAPAHPSLYAGESIFVHLEAAGLITKAKCGRCDGKGYKQSENWSDKEIRVIEGQRYTLIKTPDCHRCNGTGTEPPCDVCHNSGVVRTEVPTQYMTGGGQVFSGTRPVTSACYKCNRGQGRVFLI